MLPSSNFSLDKQLEELVQLYMIQSHSTLGTYAFAIVLGFELILFT